MALQDVLASIPGRGAYLAQQQYDQQQGAGQLAQLLGVANFVETQKQRAIQQQLLDARAAEIQRKTAEAADLNAQISQLPPDQQILARMNPAEYVRNVLRTNEGKVVPPGAALVQGGKPIYENPRAEKDNRHPTERLLDAAGITDPAKRSQIISQILQKQATHAPGVNVYSTSMQAGVDAQDRPVFVQPSARADIPPRVVEGVYPAPRAGNERVNQQTQVIASEYDAADQLLSNMIRSIQANPRMSVGIPGVAGQAVETVRGTAQAGVPTPAIDLQSQKEMLISKLKGLAVRKDSNYSNRDAERDEQAMGLDKMFTTPEAAVRALTSVQNDLRRKRSAFVQGTRAAPRAEGMPSASDIDAELKRRGL